MAKAIRRETPRPQRTSPRTDARLRWRVVSISPKWQEDVIAALDKAGITEPALAERIDVAQSTVHTTLHSKTAKHSALVVPIHEVLGWDPPPEAQAPVVLPPSEDALAMARLFDQLPEKIRAKMRDDAKMYLEILADRKDDN